MAGAEMQKPLSTAARWVAFIVIFLLGTLSAFALTKSSPVLTVIGSDFGMGLATVGWINSAFSVMGMVVAFPSALLIQKLGIKGTLLLSVGPVKGLVLKADATSRYREGRYTDTDGSVHAYGGVLLIGAGAEYTWRSVMLYVRGYNLTDRHYRDHGGVPQPGATVLAGLRVSIE